MALLEVREVAKVYGDDGTETPALQGVSFAIARGEFVAIMGPSGSGKSTLLHILGFLDRQSSGTYRFDGKSMDEYRDDELAQIRNTKMGFVFQAFNLLPRATVFENVQLPLLYSGIPDREWRTRVEDAITRVGLDHRKRHLASQLSGGEKQRVAIARALIMKPQVIFADEPTGNLDSKSGKAVMEILQDLNERETHTIVLITHETYTAEHAARIIHILDGIVASDERVKDRHHAAQFFKK
jgi:putative ABC transport system ATP-binding protein